MSSSAVATAAVTKTSPLELHYLRPPNVPFWNVERHHRAHLAMVLPYMTSQIIGRLSLVEYLRSLKWSSEFVKSGEASIETDRTSLNRTEEAYRLNPTGFIESLSDLVGVFFFTLVRYDFRFRFFSRTNLGAYFDVGTLRNDNDYCRSMNDSEKSRLSEVRRDRPRYGTKFYRDSYTYATKSQTWTCFCERIRLFCHHLGIRHLSTHLFNNLELLHLYGTLQQTQLAIETLRHDFQLSAEEVEWLKPELRLANMNLTELRLRLDDREANREADREADTVHLKRTIETDDRITTTVRFRYLLENLPGKNGTKLPNGQKASATRRWKDFFTVAFDYADQSKDTSSVLHCLVRDNGKEKLRAQGRNLFKTLSQVVHKNITIGQWDPGILKILRAIEPMQKSGGAIDLDGERRRYGPPEIFQRAIIAPQTPGKAPGRTQKAGTNA